MSVQRINTRTVGRRFLWVVVASSLPILPALAQSATSDSKASPPAAPVGSVQVRPPKEKPSYPTELPKPELAAEDGSRQESASESKLPPTPVGDEERPSIDAPVMIEDIDVAELHEFELEITFDWSHKGYGLSQGKGEKPKLINEYEIKYGLAPNLEVGLAIPIDLGDGRVEGNADIELLAKYCLWKDKDWYPGFAINAAMRLPSGVDSSGVDGEFNFILSKNFSGHRFHVNGILKTANGHNVEDLRHFQWGVGAGYDHTIFDNKTLLIVDYFNKSSEELGNSNSNYLEVGIQREIVEHHTLGVSMRVGLDNGEETTGFGVGVKYVFGMK